MPHFFFSTDVCEHSYFSDSKKIKFLFDDSKYYVFPNINNVDDNKFNVSLSIDKLQYEKNYLDTFHNLYRISSKFVLIRCSSAGSPKNIKNEYQRNLTESDFGSTMTMNKMFSSYNFYYDEQECNLYFWGVKN